MSRGRGIGPGAVIKGILGLQLGLGALLLAGDFSAGFQGFGFGPKPPALDAPVRPGDQTRRYRPGASPGDMPDRPTRPFPATTDMPSRLSFTPETLDSDDVLRVTGAIAPGDAERMADYLDAEEAPLPIYLNSAGGSVEDALAIGRMLRERAVETRVAAGDLCLSACPYILAGGSIRAVDDDGFVGVHQHYFGENSVLPAFLAVEDVQRGQGRVMAYLDEMGIDLRVMGKALITPPDEIYILLPEELAEYALVTEAP